MTLSDRSSRVRAGDEPERELRPAPLTGWRKARRGVLFGLGAAALITAGGFAFGACRLPAPLSAGDEPPDLAAIDQQGELRRISDARGKPLVVYFYPKDGTPGCTEQACAFRDAWNRFEEAGVVVYGVSGDGQASKAEFAKEHALPFPVLADPSYAWADAFGVGTVLGMTARVTFLLDRDGRVVKVYPNVDPALGVTEVLADAERLVPAGEDG